MMHALYDLKEMLCKQLEDYGKKGEMSAAVLERVDMLAHAAKNLDKVIESYENTEYSNGRPYGSYYDGMSRGRRRDSMGRYASDGYSRNDGYSRTGDFTEQLRTMMEEAPDDRTRQEMQRLIGRLDNR